MNEMAINGTVYDLYINRAYAFIAFLHEFLYVTGKSVFYVTKIMSFPSSKCALQLFIPWYNIAKCSPNKLAQNHRKVTGINEQIWLHGISQTMLLFSNFRHSKFSLVLCVCMA